ncbi:MAG: transglutaminase family protein [Bifidobacteriaceae bacterium]|nr:transglutaminase family protein [Bifidobacteriaceae bacterium]
MAKTAPDPLLAATPHVDHTDPSIRNLATTLAPPGAPTTDVARAAFEYVRDRVPHTASTDRQIVTIAASTVLAEGTGICHAKANLLAALLRSRGIATGFGFQRLTLADDESEGYCLHAFAIARLDGRLVPLDPRPDAKFSTDDPRLMFPSPLLDDESTLPGLWANPDPGTMAALEVASTLDAALAALPDQPSVPPLDPTFAVTSTR